MRDGWRRPAETSRPGCGIRRVDARRSACVDTAPESPASPSAPTATASSRPTATGRSDSGTPRRAKLLVAGVFARPLQHRVELVTEADEIIQVVFGKRAEA